MALSFPSSASVGQTYSSGSSATYQYNGSYWTVVSSPTSITLNSISSSRAEVAATSFALTSSVTEVAHVGSVTFTGGYATNILSFNTNISNPNGWWNNTTKQFTPQQAGWYEVIVGYDIFCGGVDETNMLFAVNGIQRRSTGGTGMITAVLSDTIYFNGTTDNLQVACQPISGSTRGQGTSTSRLQATYLGNW